MSDELLFADWLAGEGIIREHALDLLLVSPRQFHRAPQIGTPLRTTWGDFIERLSTPKLADEKACAGGYATGLYDENTRHKYLHRGTRLLVFDIDHGGDVDRVADWLDGWAAIVHDTFRSTADDPRCRLLLLLADVIDVATYEAAHAVIRRRIRTELGVDVDEGAKDASRLSYFPVRRAGTGYRFRVNAGRAVDARKVAALLPPKPVRPPVSIAPEHADKYVQAALRRAAEAIASATEGDRHAMINREAYALARLGLNAAEIAAVLLPAFVHAAGDARRREGERTILDAVRARRGAA